MQGLREPEAELHAQSYSPTLCTRLRLTETDVTQHGRIRKVTIPQNSVELRTCADSRFQAFLVRKGVVTRLQQDMLLTIS